MGREKRLVARDDRCARGERPKNVGARGFDSAHELNDDVGLVDDRLGIVRQKGPVDGGIARS